MGGFILMLQILYSVFLVTLRLMGHAWGPVRAGAKNLSAMDWGHVLVFGFTTAKNIFAFLVMVLMISGHIFIDTGNGLIWLSGMLVAGSGGLASAIRAISAWRSPPMPAPLVTIPPKLDQPPPKPGA